MKPYYKNEKAGVVLYHGDCLELLNNVEADCVVTDPPYGIALKSHGQHFYNSDVIKGDADSKSAETVYGICDDRQWPVAMFFSPYRWFTNGWRSVLVWERGLHVGIGGDRETCWKRDVEMIGVAFNKPLSGQRDSSILRFNACLQYASEVHPAAKPISLMEYLVSKLTAVGDLVCDPFAGVCSTGVACVRLGRHFTGIEIEEKYCEISAKRLDKEIKNWTGGLLGNRLPITKRTGSLLPNQGGK